MRFAFFEKWRQRFQAFEEHPEIERWLALVRPAPPYDRDALIAACITVTSMLSLLLLAGISFLSMGTLFVALLLIFLILSQVFGIELRFDPSMLYY